MPRTEATEEELLNRLAAIQAAAEILDDHCAGLSQQHRRQFLQAIRAETQRMEALVRQIARMFPDCMRLPASA